MNNRASYHQERLFFIDNFEKNDLYEKNPVYHNVPLILNIHGYIDAGKLEKSFKSLINNHPIFKTNFSIRNGILNKEYNGSLNFELKVEKLDGRCKKDLVNNFVKEPLNLEDDLLIRAKLLSEKTNSHKLIICLHHIICDKQSLNLIFDEIFDNYEDKTSINPEADYNDFSEWQRNLTDKHLEPYFFYWRRKLNGKIKSLDLPIERARNLIHMYKSKSQKIEIPSDINSKLKKFCSTNDKSEFSFLLSCFKITLSIFSNQKEIVVGITNKNRNTAKLEKIIGPIANLQPIRSFITEDVTFLNYLESVNRSLEEATKYKDIPFDKLVMEIKPEKDMSRTALFDILFQFESDCCIHRNLKDCLITAEESNLGWGKYDLNLLISNDNNSLSGILVYNTLYYNDNFILRFIDQYINVIENCINKPNVLINTIDFITEDEKHRQLFSYNEPNSLYPKNLTIHQLFEQQVELYPENIAVKCEEKEISYTDLNKRANKLAHVLRDAGVKREQVLGIIAERSIDMMIGILAILKAGGAYLPINPDYPDDRIGFMISDSGISTLVITKDVQLNIESEVNIIYIESQITDNKELFNLENINISTDLAYVIYTSGTTGTPKGAMIQHNNIIQLYRNENPLFAFRDDDIWSFFHSFCFDFSVWEMYGALLNGGKLVIISNKVARSSQDFLSSLIKNKVTILNQTPSSFYNLVYEESKKANKELQIRTVIFGGEALKLSNLKSWSIRYPYTDLINMYGITETTIHVTYKKIGKSDINDGLSNIGKALPALSTYVMNENRKLLPTGVIGELYVGGEGVSRGYLNRKELTKERFIKNPYIIKEIIYKTGDRVKMLENGDLLYMGRIDQQVKIRGFRIELGEIETRLLNIQGIKEAIVLPIEGKDLCAYYEVDSDINTNQIKKHLSGYLPDYMIPSFFIKMERLPLTHNGKLDITALPEPTINIITDVEYIAPRNKLENDLVQIWEEVIDVKPIGINNSFFDIGGQSLKATMLISRIKKELLATISLKELFQNPTIAEISLLVDTAKKSEYKHIESAPNNKFYELSNAQRRLWVLDQLEEDNIAYNMPAYYFLQGELSIDSFKKAFTFMIERHESLRTMFVTEKGEPRQKILEIPDLNLEVIDLKDSPNKEKKIRNLVEKDIITPFNLESGLLIRLSIVEMEDELFLLLLNMHHIVSDGWSMNIFVREFLACYIYFKDGKRPDFKPLRIHYKDYSTWQNNLLESDYIIDQQKYWLDKLAGELPVLNLPSDKTRPVVQTYNGKNLEFSISKEINSSLNDLCKENHVSLFMMLQALVKSLFHRYTGQNDIILGSPIAGRNHGDLENQIGFYVNTLVLRDSVEGDLPFKELLNRVRQTCIDAFDNQDYPFDRLVEDVGIKRELSRSPLFDVMLVLHNNDTANIKFDGLTVSPYEADNLISKFDMTFNFTETENGLICEIEYNTDLYSEDRIERMVSHFSILIESVIANSARLIRELEIIPEHEKNLLLNFFNDKKVEYPIDKTIIQLFEEQVEKNPENIALVYDDINISYTELNKKANNIGHYLRDNYDIRPDDLVGVMLERSEKMIIAILGILKSGAAYVPIDPKYPENRIEFMLQDSNPKVVLSKRGNGFFLDIDNILENELCINNFDRKVKPDNLAYVIYTSGSTGKPKGTLVEQKSVIRLIHNTNYISINSKDRIFQSGSLSFDASTFEIWGALLNGAALYLSKDILDLNNFSNDISKNKITILWLTARLFDHFVSVDISMFKPLKKLLIGGDTLSYQHVNEVKQLYPELSIINGYGPTENTTFTCCFNIDKIYSKDIPIGKPISNTQVYILDSHNTPTPIGVAGELCVSGSGLARGYLNRPELTNEKFVENPINVGERMYRTGDLARWLPCGNIEFLGRMDNQIKIRGFRIEPGEIENTLVQKNDIKSAVVLAKENSEVDKFLVAYYVSEEKVEVSILRNFLAKSLPEYMIPSLFIYMETIPLTSNGKIDFEALPEPEGSVNTVEEYEAPQSETEIKLVAIWEEVLGNKLVGIHDNFIILGGHSLNAIRIISMIYKEFNIDIKLGYFFKKPTIENIADYIDVIQMEGNVKFNNHIREEVEI